MKQKTNKTIDVTEQETLLHKTELSLEELKDQVESDSENQGTKGLDEEDQNGI